MEMHEPQEYAQTHFSEERRQRVSQAKKRYNCYTEKNIVILRIEVDIMYTFRRHEYEKEAARCQAKASKHCSTEKRQQETQVMQLSTDLSHSVYCDYDSTVMLTCKLLLAVAKAS